MNNYRHGDLALIEIKKLPNGLKETKSKVIMVGSGGHEHSFDKGKLFLKEVDNFTSGYFVAKNTTLLHVEHGCKCKKANIGLKKAKIKDGIYELRKQCEFVNDEIRPVED